MERGGRARARSDYPRDLIQAEGRRDRPNLWCWETRQAGGHQRGMVGTPDRSAPEIGGRGRPLTGREMTGAPLYSQKRRPYHFTPQLDRCQDHVNSALTVRVSPLSKGYNRRRLISTVHRYDRPSEHECANWALECPETRTNGIGEADEGSLVEMIGCWDVKLG